MSKDGKTTGADLIAGIIEGKVPRQVRLFAAQGLLPVSREDLLCMQTILSADPDEVLALTAAESLRSEDEQTILGWLRDAPPEPLVLDLLIRVRDGEETWAAVAAHANTPDETLRVLARNGTPLIQDIIITNQVRLFGCLEILDDLRENPQATPVIRRRVREFEEEFIEKAIAEEAALATAGPSVEEALGALRAIGAHIPKEDTMPYPETMDPALVEAVKKSSQSTHARLLKMTVYDRIITALRGSREERMILVNSRNRLIQRSVLACPKLTDSEIEQYASSRSVAEEVIKQIASTRKWLRHYPVIIALALNPKTPVYTAKSIIPRLNHRDKVRVSRDRNISPVTRQIAQKATSTRR